MKILILTNKVGGGHNSTANALKIEFEKYDNVECKIIDSFEYISPVLQEGISKSYILSTTVFPYLYAGGYRYQEIMDEKETKDAGDNVVNYLFTQKLLTYFEEEFYPDIVISTHIFSAQLINLMLEKKLIDVISVGIITDFTIHPHWCRLSNLDYFVTASELLTYQAVKKGIKKEKILPFGIPINDKFNVHINKMEAKRMLGLNENKKTILFMSGSMGYGNTVKMIKRIDHILDDFELLVVCGNSKKSKKDLEKTKFHHNVKIYGFVDNVDVMMSACDLVITKPGGLTSCEVLSKNLPMIMVNPIPGQEERNVEFLTNNGCAVYSTPTFPVDEAFYQLYCYQEKLENMKKNISMIRKPNAATDICKFLINI